MDTRGVNGPASSADVTCYGPIHAVGLRASNIRQSVIKMPTQPAVLLRESAERAGAVSRKGVISQRWLRHIAVTGTPEERKAARLAMHTEYAKKRARKSRS